MRRLALAAAVAALAGFGAGAANASITLDFSFSDATFDVSGGFHATFDSIPPDTFNFFDGPSIGCHVSSPAGFTCDGAFVTRGFPGLEDGIQINLDNTDGSSGPGLAFSFPTLLTSGTYGNLNDVDGHEATLTIANTAVPEPATWAMLLAGFAGLGAGLRARRRAILASAV